MNPCRILAALSALFTLPFTGVAGSRWLTRQWQSDDGLPNNIVTSLAQTPDGYVWAATPSRVARFDGVQFDELAPANLDPGRSPRFTAIMADRSGGLWLGAPGAVLHFRDGKGETFATHLPDLTPQTLTEDDEGGIWVTFRGEAVCRIKSGHLALMTAAEGLPPGAVTAFARDGKGVFWFAKGGRIGVVRDGRFQTFFRLGGYATPVRLAGAKAGGIWIAFEHNLYRYEEGGSLRNCGSFPATPMAGPPNAVWEDAAGGVWIGTSSSGLFRYERDTFEGVPTSHREILSLLEDRKGNLWVGTGGGGLDRIHLRAVTLQNVDDGLPFETVQSLCEDSEGGVWAATLNGALARRAAGRWSTVSAAANWPGGRATCVASDKTGAVWIGTRDYALHRWRDGHYTTWRQANGLGCRNVHSLLATEDGDLWVAGDAPDSLQCLRAGKFAALRLPANVRMIRTMAADREGNVWIASVNGRLLRARGESLSDETARTGRHGDNRVDPFWSIRTLGVTPDGSVWIGYTGAGLGRLRNSGFRRLTTDDGLPDDFISQIVADGQGWLWFGADHGIFKQREDELDAALDRGGRVQSITYGQDEGLRSLQANFGNSPGAIRGRDGKLWIPFLSALAMVDPGKLREDSRPPSALVQQVRVDDQIVAAYGGALPVGNALRLPAPSARLRLPPAHRRIVFRFTSLDAAMPEDVRFRYRLVGFDRNWILAGPERTAEYSRLPARDYRFEISASSRAGAWNPAAASIRFSVAAFFWQTWWFCGALALTLSVVLVWAVRYLSFRRLQRRLQALERQNALERERSRIARDLHDDLGSQLTKIVLLGDLTRDYCTQSSEGGETARLLAETARGVVKSLDETVWAVNPRNDTLANLIDYIGQFALEFLRAAGIRCRLDLPALPTHQPVAAEVRHNLFLMAKEALNNAARHARATEVFLRVTAAGSLHTLIVEDNGVGFTPGSGGAGDGLRNLRSRAREIGGRTQIESGPGRGTRVIITFRC